MIRPLLLASSSPYRKALLARLGLPFTTASPDLDETPLPDEPAEELARRLAAAKARALADAWPDHLIIGSDQTAALDDGRILGKPGSHDRACEQLSWCSGRSVCFIPDYPCSTAAAANSTPWLSRSGSTSAP